MCYSAGRDNAVSCLNLGKRTNAKQMAHRLHLPPPLLREPRNQRYNSLPASHRPKYYPHSASHSPRYSLHSASHSPRYSPSSASHNSRYSPPTASHSPRYSSIQFLIPPDTPPHSASHTPSHSPHSASYSPRPSLHSSVSGTQVLSPSFSFRFDF